MIYLIIFISKIIENSLATLRLIIVANGKKMLGAILQIFISLVWIIITSIVIINIKNDYFKAVAFILGSAIGSYVGSIIEEYIAMGNNMIICIINPKLKFKITHILECNKYKMIETSDNKKIIVLAKRKQKTIIKNIVKEIDHNSTIIVEKVLFY